MPGEGTADRTRYVIERTLGRGEMATVHLARDSELDRPVALKVLAEHLAGDAAFRTRFLREARLAARLVHPNVVQFYDVGEDERGLFIVMEYVEGETLADELRRRGRLPPAEVVGGRASFVLPPRQPRQPGNKVAEFGLVTGKPQVPAPAT